MEVRDDRDSIVVGQQMKLPTLEDLKRYIRATHLPFVIKGALSVHDAQTCVDLGCVGVILSHHNGLMRWATPPAMVLPEIRKAVGSSLTLIADGGVEDGYDAFKLLALGADAVSVGRPLMQPLEKGGSAAMAETLRAFTAELRAMMVRTGTPDLEHMDPTVIHLI